MDIRNKRILVTGGAGFIGSNLVAHLLERGNQVVVLDDFSTGKQKNLQDLETSPGLRIVRGSILDYALVSSLVAESQIVFHLAVQCLRLSFTNPVLVHEVNATGTLNLLRACLEGSPSSPEHFSATTKSHFIERFVYVSSSEVYGTAKSAPMNESHPLEPLTVYGASKLAGEMYTLAHFHSWSLPAVLIRPFNSYGYNEHWEGSSGEVIPRFAARILNGLPPCVFGDGEQTRDFTFVSETARGMVEIAECDQLLGQAVNLAYGQEVSVKRIAELLLQKLNKTSLGIEYLPDRPGDVRRHYADISKLINSTNYRPEIAIEKGLDLFLDWFKDELQKQPELLASINTRNWS